ncbi:hypothetical protein [Bacteroides acidifaciens]|uniref:STM4504/CBY_0614 family protein n=1 Tax=Bacteroides acidifaciens TaxID=85831 RepID=UPI00242ED025|nr:hypothetical protein [Bacteroides acidifaciens]
MAIIDLFSKRLARSENKGGQLYIYDDVPQKLRQQIWYIFKKSGFGTKESICKILYEILCEENGVACLVENLYTQSISVELYTFFIGIANPLQALDIIELIGRSIYKMTHPYVNLSCEKREELINEINIRFKENGIGYQFENGYLVRLDSTYMHSEVVKPAISLLSNDKFKGALDEYMKAHRYYKNSDNSACLNECLKAFESTMKIICKAKGWSYSEKDTASGLIATCFENKLIPSYMQNQFNSLRVLLGSGVPTNRNKNSGHGQGSEIRNIPASLARYTLNLAGSNIIFLIEQSGL